MGITGSFPILIRVLPCFDPHFLPVHCRTDWRFCVLDSFRIISNSLAVLTLMCGVFIPKLLTESEGFKKSLH